MRHVMQSGKNSSVCNGFEGAQRTAVGLNGFNGACTAEALQPGVRK